MKLSMKNVPESAIIRDKFGLVIGTYDSIMDDNTVELLGRKRRHYERKMRRAQFASEAAYYLRKMLRVQSYAQRVYGAVV